MGMSTHIKAITPPNDNWRKMKAIYVAYETASLPIPEDIQAFFNYTVPDDKGVVIDLYNHAAVTEFETEHAKGHDIDLTKLPPQTSVLRIYNAW